MVIAYVDDNSGRAFSFRSAVTETKATHQLLNMNNGKAAVVTLLNHPTVPHYIFIHCRITDVKCNSLMQFVTHHERLSAARVVVVNGRFSDSEKLEYQKAGAFACVADDSHAAMVSSLKQLLTN